MPTGRSTPTRPSYGLFPWMGAFRPRTRPAFPGRAIRAIRRPILGQKVEGAGSAPGWNGKVTAFSSTPALDSTVGDASAAYPGALSSAIRQVWYLRALDVVVVRGKLASPQPHVFEWNVHAPSAIIAQDNNSLRINNADRSLCVKSLIPDAQFARRTGPPPKAGRVEEHGYFRSPSATSAEFLVLIDVRCKNPATSLSRMKLG